MCVWTFSFVITPPTLSENLHACPSELETAATLPQGSFSKNTLAVELVEYVTDARCQWAS